MPKLKNLGLKTSQFITFQMKRKMLKTDLNEIRLGFVMLWYNDVFPKIQTTNQTFG